ncbi:MAG: magnesium/cobalt transporter CorA [Nitrospirota bacterium]
MKRRSLRSMSEKAGLPPGTPVFVGEKKAEETRITVMDYDEEHVQAWEARSVDECLALKDTPSRTWVHVEGFQDVEAIEALGRGFDVHPLVTEDILNTEQRPKTEVFDDYVFIVAKAVRFSETMDALEVDHVCLVLGKNFLLTFQDGRGDLFAHVRTRVRNARGIVRRAGMDYLAYVLLDSIVDGLFIVLEKLDDIIAEVEEEVTGDAAGPQTLARLHVVKRQVVTLSRIVWPMRDIAVGLTREESAVISAAMEPYLRDIHDHAVQVIETIEAFRDMTSALLDVYLSGVSNKLNEVMKVLTVFASLFIPLTFITGIYGMNFAYMPELHWKWGYFAVLGVMAGLGAALLLFFRKKGFF